MYKLIIIILLLFFLFLNLNIYDNIVIVSSLVIIILLYSLFLSRHYYKFESFNPKLSIKYSNPVILSHCYSCTK